MLLPTTFSASRKCVIPILLRRGISQHTSPGRFVRKARTQVQFLPKTSVRSNSSFKSGGSDKFSPRNAEEAEAHLKISRPGYYKLLKEARAVDDLPKSWDLIFHGKKSRKYIIFGHWAFLFTVIITPIVTAYVVWENQYEEDVIIAGWIISKSVEMALFVIMQGLILYSFFRPYSHMPLRIYFNSTEDKYMAIFISKLAPWKTTRVEFRATDVSAHKTNLMMLRKDCEYRVRQKPMTFPPLYFRSGDDEFRLLRFKDLPDHQRH